MTIDPAADTTSIDPTNPFNLPVLHDEGWQPQQDGQTDPPSVVAGQSAASVAGRAKWCETRPDIMVVACSDGRLQESLDSFLVGELGIKDYDRLFVPGGSGALVPGGYQFMRAEMIRKELLFLIEKHGTDEVILIAHGAADDGPDEATCAHYKRTMPSASPLEIKEQQIADIRSFRQSAKIDLVNIRVRAYRAEVMADRTVQYVEIG